MDTTQVDFAAANHFQENREAPSGPRRTDAFGGSRLGHVVSRHTKVEERWMPVLGPELAPVDDIDVPQQRYGVVVALSHQVAELVQQGVIRQSVERID